MSCAWYAVWFAVAVLGICVWGCFRRINSLEGRVRRLQEARDRDPDHDIEVPQ